jgi:hypothetical protein
VTVGRRRSVAIPELKECPDCGMLIQAGKNPHGLAYHECKRVAKATDPLSRLLDSDEPLDEKKASDAVLKAALAAAREHASSPTVLLEIYRTMRSTSTSSKAEEGRGRGAPSKTLVDWLQGEAFEDDEDDEA